MRESHRRSIVKALSWRALATVITVIAALLITGEIMLVAQIGLLDTLVKLVVYYFHERTWIRIRYGQTQPPEYTI